MFAPSATAVPPAAAATGAGTVSPVPAATEASTKSEDVPISSMDMVRNQKIPSSLGGELKQQEYQMILEALIDCRGNRQAVSEKLGISPRTLRYKIAKMRDEGLIIPS